MIDLDANQLWVEDGIILDMPSNNSQDVIMTTDSEGNLYFNYHTNSDWELQKVLPDGTLPWTIGGIDYSTNQQGAPDNLVVTSCDDIMVSFDGQDEIISASRISSDGNSIFNPNALPLTFYDPEVQHRDPKIGINENDRVLVVWAYDPDVNDSDMHLHMQGFSKDGMLGITTNIEETKQFDLEVFPNPVQKNHYLEIRTSNNSFVNIMLSDVAGKIITLKNNVKFENGVNQFKIPEEVTHGIYFLQLVTDQGILTKKISIF